VIVPHVRHRVTSVLLVLGLAIAIWPAAAHAAGVVTTTFGGNQVVVYPTPNAGLPTPTAIVVSGLPAGAQPHSVSCVGPDTCLVADAGNFRILVVRVSTASVVDTIATGGFSGSGTVAINPAGTFALAADPVAFVGQLLVIAAPFGSGSAITTVPLAGAIQPAGSNAIVFAPNGRAFVCTGGGIAVLDPPYAGIAFTIPLGTGCGELAVTPDGNQLLAPFDTHVNVFTAPFSGASAPAVLPLPEARGVVGVAVAPDGGTALVADVSGTTVWAIAAPFGAASAVQPIPLPAGFGALREVAISPDGTLAILVGGGANAFVRPPFTTAGATAFAVPVAGGNGLGGVTFLGPAGPPTTGPAALVAAVLPSSRSVSVGVPATAFLTVINPPSSTETATNVTIQPATPIPANFLFQTTDPNTNAVTGAPNTPVSIPPGQPQSFVIAFTPTAPFNPTDVAFTIGPGAGQIRPVASVPGLNTLLLSASVGPVPDIVALGATIGNTGTVNLPAATNAGAFAVATVNVGVGASITVLADTGIAVLPITILVCQTNPGDGLCLAPPAARVTTVINAQATPTFAFFVLGQGFVNFDPAINRIFVRFIDGGGVTRGSTSVAVQSTN
jgi:hypothetical protein